MGKQIRKQSRCYKKMPPGKPGGGINNSGFLRIYAAEGSNICIVHIVKILTAENKIAKIIAIEYTVKAFFRDAKKFRFIPKQRKNVKRYQHASDERNNNKSYFANESYHKTENDHIVSNTAVSEDENMCGL